LHFCDVTLSAKKPLTEAYPKTVQTIGDHLRKKRLDLKVFQRDVAKRLGVTTSTITNWEKNRGGPALRLIPKIITFLGSDPFPQAVSSLRGKILQYRWTQGLTIKKLAGILGIDPTTLARWERGEVEPRGKLKERVNSFLKILTGQAKLVVNQS